jgi:DNA-binding IscR family transcriptional regulator
MLLEGGLKLTDCVAQTGICERSGQCVARILWTEISQAVVEKLQAMSLKDLMDREEAFSGLEECGNRDGKPVSLAKRADLSMEKV